MNGLKRGLCTLLGSSSGASRASVGQEGWELELLPGSFGAGLRLVPSTAVWRSSQKVVFSMCLSVQHFWLVFLFLGFTSRNCRAGRALTLRHPANESKESFLAALGVAS